MLRTLTLAALAALVVPGAAMAQSAGSSFALGGNIGTPGIGVSAQFRATDQFVIRGDLDWLKYSHDEDYSDISYDGKLKSMTGGVFADWHPGGSAFLVSGGAYVGTRKVDFEATPTTNVEIGGQTFTPDQVGRIDGRAKFSKLQPFVGLGYDNTWTGDRAWGFRALVGVSFSKKPDIELRSEGGLVSTQPAFLARLEQEEDEIREDAKNIRYYPIVQVGVTRRF